MTQDLGKLIREPAKHGWRVCNLIELADGGWQCNLYGPEGRSFNQTEMAQGRTPEEAVAAAVENIRHAKAFAAKQGLPFETAGEKRAAKNLEIALARLALTAKGIGIV